jgi:PPM family protein phosphatase
VSVLRVAEEFHKSDTGRQRRGNEDALYARAPLFVVADGMGGAQAGEVASRMAVETVGRGLPDGGDPPQELLAARIVEANEQIHERSREDADAAGMGTTLTAIYVGSEEAAIAHVGDSRAYRLRDGRLERLTDDHSLVEEFLRQGKLSPEEARDHPQKSIITRALGPEPAVEVDRQTVPLRDGDVFLLCSDGLTSMVDEPDIERTLAGSASLDAAGQALVRAANEAGGRDNITVVLFRVEDVDGAGAPATREHQATAAGTAAPRTEDVRAAVATAEREATEQRVEPRRARRRQPAPAQRRRRRLPGWAKAALVALVVLVPVVIGLWVASQAVYFIGTDERAQVAVFRGLPYDLPLGLDLYTTNYVSGVPATEVAPARQQTLLDHTLRSRDDAYDLVRQLERGRIR